MASCASTRTRCRPSPAYFARVAAAAAHHSMLSRVMDAQGGKLTKSLHALECNVAGIVDRVAESGDATNKRMYIILSSASAPALKLSPIAEYATLSLFPWCHSCESHASERSGGAEKELLKEWGAAIIKTHRLFVNRSRRMDISARVVPFSREISAALQSGQLPASTHRELYSMPTKQNCQRCNEFGTSQRVG